MTGRIRLLAIAGAAIVVLLAGGIYTAVRTESWRSEAQLVAHLGKVRAERVPSLLDGYLRSGATGTFVEHVTSAQTLGSAGAFGLTVDARAVPDTRVIDISATGSQARVQAGLVAVVRQAQLTQNQLKEPFRLGVLSPPGPPVKAGPSTPLLLVATLLLAALAALFVTVVTRRFTPSSGRPVAVAEDGPTAGLRPAPAPEHRAAGGR